MKYKCHKCGVSGVKLWRQYNTFLEHQRVMCVDCTLIDQGLVGTHVSEDGYNQSEYGKTDQLSWMVPAVPTIEMDTYWGYTSVPEDRVKWWRELPLRLPGFFFLFPLGKFARVNDARAEA